MMIFTRIATHLRARRMRRERRPELLGGIAVMALVTLYFTTRASSSDLYVFNLCLLAAIGASALNLLMGTAGQVSIGSAAFLLVGAFGTVWAHRLGIVFPLDIIAATAIGAAVGLLVGLPALRIQGLYLALATLAVHFIALYVANEYQANAQDAGAGGFQVSPKFSHLGLLDQQRAWSWVLFGLVAATTVLMSRLLTARSGRALRLIRTHETVAAVMGIPVARTKLVLFMGTSAATAAQGGITEYLTGSVSVEGYTLLLAVSYIAMIIIGGLDSLWGGTIGAGVVISLSTISTNAVSRFSPSPTAALHGPQIAQVVFGALIIVFVLFSRNGIAGWPKAAAQVLARLQRNRSTTP
ncbi:branched-chain amino acid ABC transporter permease [Streptomyces sp. NPDC001276]|uniref:branched-chain amino acid ABC transporter permease n=1 Tax=Streptomyces sp. NPDC001276 TaxID=3364555 RepID=UPI0036C7594C